MPQTLEVICFYTSIEAATAHKFVLRVTDPLKMRQAKNREVVNSILADLQGDGCVVRDATHNTCTVFRKLPMPKYCH